jgi:protein-S-isoprenylcysteine O-methyltransferase Ste14
MVSFFAYAALAAGVIFTARAHAWPLPLPSAVTVAIGATLLACGGAVYVIGRLQLRSFRATWGLATDRLLTTGIYRLVRHPQNLGWGLLLTGVAMLGGSGVALALTGAYVFSCVIWLPVEEAYLERMFGSRYSSYHASTPALVPFTIRGRSKSSA